MDINSLFSQDYFTAREKFLNQSIANGFELESFKHPTQTGPNNRDIFMDCAQSGPKEAKNLLIVISGTHGPEGYCGSAVQTGLLQSGIAKKWAEKSKIAFIHAHNAYGFAWDTRFNEDNIDLNRNYLDDWKNLPQNPAYDEVAQWALPVDFSPESLTMATAKLMEYAQNNGFPALQAALTGGQYNHPKGVYYGGTAPSWSNKTITNLIDKLTIGIEHLIIIDMHTGLGPFGHGEILCDCPDDSKAYEKLFAIWGNEVKSTKSQNSISADLKGSMDGALMRRYAALDPAVIAIEFGTIDPLSVFRATQATSWLHSYGDKNGEMAKEITQLSRDAFYPQSQEWNEKVWRRSLEVISKAFDAL